MGVQTWDAQCYLLHVPLLQKNSNIVTACCFLKAYLKCAGFSHIVYDITAIYEANYTENDFCSED